MLNMSKSKTRANLKQKFKSNVNLREKMLSRMDSARLRFLNDQMYNDNNNVLKKKTAFKIYHESFKKQQEQWDSNPLDFILKDLKSMYSASSKKTGFVKADLGCGDAKIAEEFAGKEVLVHSIDFVATNKNVTACDMANTKIPQGSVDVVVFCLSLISSNCGKFVKEAKRILKTNGRVLIAEVTSQIGDEKAFIDALKEYGLALYEKIYVSQQYFTYFKFKSSGTMKSKPKDIILQPCKYKKR